MGETAPGGTLGFCAREKIFKSCQTNFTGGRPVNSVMSNSNEKPAELDREVEQGTSQPNERTIVAEIAADKSAPATARVHAARALLKGQRKQDPKEVEAGDGALSTLSERAVDILISKRRKAEVEEKLIPIAGQHRGVPLHAGQPSVRVENVVKPDLDHVAALDDPQALLEFARSAANAPEARLFAAAKCRAVFETAVTQRLARPAIDLALVDAVVAGADSLRWADPDLYCSLLDVYSDHVAVRDALLPVAA